MNKNSDDNVKCPPIIADKIAFRLLGDFRNARKMLYDLCNKELTPALEPAHLKKCFSKPFEGLPSQKPDAMYPIMETALSETVANFLIEYETGYENLAKKIRRQIDRARKMKKAHKQLVLIIKRYETEAITETDLEPLNSTTHA